MNTVTSRGQAIRRMTSPSNDIFLFSRQQHKTPTQPSRHLLHLISHFESPPPSLQPPTYSRCRPGCRRRPRPPRPPTGQTAEKASDMEELISQALQASQREEASMDELMMGRSELVVMTKQERAEWEVFRAKGKPAALGAPGIASFVGVREAFATTSRTVKLLELRFGMAVDEGVRQQYALDRQLYGDYLGKVRAEDVELELERLCREAKGLVNRLTDVVNWTGNGVAPFCKHVLNLRVDNNSDLSPLDVALGRTLPLVMANSLERRPEFGIRNLTLGNGKSPYPFDVAHATWRRCEPRLRALLPEPVETDRDACQTLFRSWIRASGSREFHDEQPWSGGSGEWWIRWIWWCKQLWLWPRLLASRMRSAGFSTGSSPGTSSRRPSHSSATDSQRRVSGHREEKKVWRIASLTSYDSAYSDFVLVSGDWPKSARRHSKHGQIGAKAPTGLCIQRRWIASFAKVRRGPHDAMDDTAKTTAKWGAACAMCASAKAKCIRRNEDPDAKCDRCERLYKNCVEQVHRPRKKRTSKTSKTAQLEERLNGLVDLLRASGELNNTLPVADGSPYTAPTTISHSASPRSPQTTRRETAASPWLPAEATIPASYNSFAPPTCICRPETGDVVTTVVETDEELLDHYRTHAFPQYPFVVVTADTAAATLAAERPFLMMAIRVVASVHNTRYMQGAMYRLIRHVAEYVVLRSERSLDLVQGLLVVIGWYHHHCMMHAQLNNLLFLGISMMADLGLSRAPRIAERTQLMVLHPNVPTPRTHEERRVLLGYWYMSSCLALGFQKVETMRFSPYARQCLDELAAAPEYASDEYLVTQVRLQRLADKVARMNRPEDGEDDMAGCVRAPPTAYQQAFQSELDRLCGGMSAALRGDNLIANQVATIRLRLYEPPLLDAALLQRFASDFTVGAPSGLDALYRAHDALRGWFDQWFSIAVEHYLWVPIPMCVQLIYGITMLSRWARLVGYVRPGERESVPGIVVSVATLPQDPSNRWVPGQGVLATAMTPPVAPPVPAVSALSMPLCPPFAGLEAREISSDPKLQAALAQMRDTLRHQPGLLIDIAAVLVLLGERFEQSNVQIRTAGAARFGDSVGRGLNIWDLTARKIAIMRSKLLRHADELGLAGQGGGGLAGDDSPGGAGGSSGGNPKQKTGGIGPSSPPSQQQQQQQQQRQQQQQQQQQPLPDLSFDPGLGAEDATAVLPMATGTFDCNSPWVNEMFDDLDAGLWLDSLQWVPTTG